AAAGDPGRAAEAGRLGLVGDATAARPRVAGLVPAVRGIAAERGQRARKRAADAALEDERADRAVGHVDDAAGRAILIFAGAVGEARRSAAAVRAHVAALGGAVRGIGAAEGAVHAADGPAHAAAKEVRSLGAVGHVHVAAEDAALVLAGAERVAGDAAGQRRDLDQPRA